MSYQISTTQIDPETDLTHFETLKSIADDPNPDWARFYSKIYDYTANLDDQSNSADPNVREWFSVAAQANAGVGAPSNLIRDYTAAQVGIRTGGTVSSATLDDASDAIASSIWQAMSSNGDLPTLEDIRTEDAQNVVNVLQNDGHNVGFNVWSGNVLFVGLGDNEPLMDNLIPSSSNSSYDLFAAGQALGVAGLGSILGSGWGSALTFLSNTTSVLAANAATDDFLSRLYGNFAPTVLGVAWSAKVGRQDNSSDLLTGTNSQDVIHSGTGDDVIVGSLGFDLLDGGEDFDFVDFGSYLDPYLLDLTNQAIGSYNGSVSYSGSVFNAELLSDSVSHLFNVEALRLGRSDDILRLDANPTLQRIDGGGSLEKGDLIDLSDSTTGATVFLEEVGSGSGSVVLTSGSLEIIGFDNVNGTQHADTITGGEDRNTLRGGADVDTIDGGEGHDDIHGGEGDDSIQGGYGADWLYDRGADDGLGENETLDQYVNRVLAYDGTGNDIVNGGAGSDILYYSGGQDVFDGGAGDDMYLVSERVSATGLQTDNLTINLSGDFGHDLIVGDPNSIDKVRFQGISTSDVTVNYQYDSTFIQSYMSNFDPLFGWTLDPSAVEAGLYSTLGTYEIIINSTGASLTIENVTGAYSQKLSGTGSFSSSAFVNSAFLLEFDDGFLDWTNPVRTSTGSDLFLVNSPISATALVARDALENERSEIEDTTEGDNTFDDELYGSTAANAMNGYGGNDTIYAGAADDVLNGGQGADYLNGGSGKDTASYANATSAVGLRLFDSDYRSGEAVGDELVSIENLEGSAFDDVLLGDDRANTIHGGDGNDQIGGGRYGEGDALYGEAGNDSLTGLIGNDTLDGGDGNDRLRAGSGNDIVLGGDGDDLLISDGNIVNITEILSPGSDILNGGAGTDTAEFYHESGLVVDMAAGRADYGGTTDFATLKNIENVTTARGNDVIYGDDQNNVITTDQGDDLLYGGGGNDTLIGGDGNDTIYGGTGIDTARVNTVNSAVTFDYVEGGVRATIDETDPAYTYGMDEGTFIIYDDVEFIEFNDTTLTYADVAGPLQTEFEVIDDYQRINEGITATIDLVANDLEFNSDPINITKLNGTAMVPNDVIRLAVGATVTMLADGRLELDQAGAFAWLDAGETATETLTYTAVDSSGIEKTATVTLVFDGKASNPDALHIDNDLVLVTTDAQNAAKISVANFNIAKSVVVIDEIYVDPNNPPAGITIEEIDGDTYIMFGTDDAVVLENISFEAWKFVSAQRTAGSAGNDVITGTYDPDVLIGEGGDDTINSGGGNDLVLGGDGNDDVGSGSGNDLIYGNAGDDTLGGGSGNDKLFGGGDNDRFWGGSGDDSLFGGAGDDHFYGGTGRDLFDGGAGVDTVELQQDDYSRPYLGVNVDLTTGIVEWENNAYPFEQLISIENVLGTAADDTILGDDGANHLDGIGGDDLLRGGAGDDTLTDRYGSNELYGEDGDDFLYVTGSGGSLLAGGAGNDRIKAHHGQNTIDGGAGSDTLDLSGANSGWNIDVDLTTGSFGTGANISNFVSIENVIGTPGDNIITGDAGANMLDGGSGVVSGNDIINGGAGNDTLTGGAGDDSHFGGDGDDLILGNIGNDSFDGGSGIDTLDFSYTSSNLTMDLPGGTVSFEGSITETATNFENAIGGAGNDQITGTGTDNTLQGLIGNDTYTTGAGSDLIRVETGSGADTVTDFDVDDDRIEIDGALLDPNQVSSGVVLSQSGADILITYGSGDSLTVSNIDLVAWQAASPSGPGGIVTGTSGNDVIDGSFTDADGDVINDLGQTIEGLGGDDLIHDGEGNDTLVGGDGNDTLGGGGGGGNDTLIGGRDTDTAVFNVDFTDATINTSGDNLVVASAAEGTDLVENDVEFLTFNDGTYSFSDLHTASNNAPVTVSDNLTVAEDQISEINVLANDTDADGDSLSVTRVGGQAISVGNPVTLPSGAIMTLLPSGALSYDPNGAFNTLETGETASETITYEVSDGQGGTTEGTLAVTIEGLTPPPPNDAPVAVDDAATIETSGSILIDVTANDTDADGDVLSLTSVTGAASGTAVIEAGQVRYTANAGFVGAEVLSYKIDDGQGGTATGSVTISVTPPSGPLGDQTGTSGADVFYHTTGNGSYAIQDLSYSGSVLDRLIFTDLDLGDVTFTQNTGKDLVITTNTGEVITITDHFDGTYEDMELIEFADGTVLNAQAIRDKSVADQKASGSVRGSEHVETYSHALGDGSYTIQDFSYSGSVQDRLVLTDVNVADVSFSQNTGKDLVITLSNGETITVTDHFDGTYEDMERIEFADGTVLNAQAIRDKSVADQKASGSVRGSEHAETYFHTMGDGSYTISDFSYSGSVLDRLVLTDQNVTDVTFSDNAGKDLIITLSNGEAITVTDHFDGTYEDMEEIQFADGTVIDTRSMTLTDLMNATGNSPPTNTDPETVDDTATVDEDGTILVNILANDTDADGDTLSISSVTGASKGTTTIEAGQMRYTPNAGFSGTDTVTYEIDDGQGGTATGSVTITVNPAPPPSGDKTGTAGADIFTHTTGDGSYAIQDLSYSSSVLDRLIFTDQDVSDVTFSQNAGEDLVITTNTGETVTITDHFDGVTEDMELIEFADGTVLNVQDTRDKTVADMKASGTVTGSELAENYTHALGDGSYTITDFDYVTQSGTDTFTFSDVNAADVIFSHGASNDLIMTLANGEAITVNNHFDADSDYAIEQVTFADGASLNPQGIRDKTVADMKVSGTITGSELAENYNHTAGDGSYTITDFDIYGNTATDSFTFSDVNAADVTFSHGASNDLIMTLANGEAITVNNHFDTDYDYGLDQIIFADGTILNWQGTRDKTVADMKVTGTVTGSELAENYNHTAGDGSYTITDFDIYGNTATDSFTFPDVNAADVTFSHGASNDLIMTLANGEAITVNNHFDTDSDYAIEQVAFADGTTLNTQGIRNKVLDDYVPTHWADIDTYLQSGVTDEFQFGNNWNGMTDDDGRIDVGFTAGTGDMSLTLKGFDIDFADEIAILLNGVQHSFLSIGQNNGLSDHTVTFAAMDLEDGDNIITFQNENASWTWGIDDLAIA